MSSTWRIRSIKSAAAQEWGSSPPSSVRGVDSLEYCPGNFEPVRPLMCLETAPGGAVSGTLAPGWRIELSMAAEGSSDRCALIAGTVSLILRALQSAAIQSHETKPISG